MRKFRAVLFLAVFSAGVAAQDNGGVMEAGDALDLDMCKRMRDQVLPRIEAFTRMKFRRTVPVRIEPKAVWDAKQKRTGYAGHSARHALAFYTPSLNTITVIPWVIGRYAGGNPMKKSLNDWIADLEPTLIHELTHAIHHQNFFSEGRFYAASLRSAGLSEEELDRSTVDFLMGEGFPELVALRTTQFPTHMHRHPRRELDGLRHYMKLYEANGKEPYRVKLSQNGYRDGLNLMHHLQLKAGSRGVRAVLYRPPPRRLLFQPSELAKLDLDDPPDPDSIFGFLSPEILKGNEIRLAVNPGHGRYFESAHRVHVRAPGCLIGYVATLKDARYAFFVADPDKPGGWGEEQLASLKALNPNGVAEKQVTLPLTKGAKVKARVVTVQGKDSDLYARVDTAGLVIVAHETKPTKYLEQRAVRALRALYIRRPTAKLYK